LKYLRVHRTRKYLKFGDNILTKGVRMYLEILVRPWFEHLFSILISITIIAYITIRRKDIIRSTQRVPRVFWIIGGITTILMLLNAYRVINEIYNVGENVVSSVVDIITSYGNLIGQTLIVFYLLEAKIVVERMITPAKVMVIGAHPDDIEIAAGASIAKLHDVGFQIVGLVLSHGERGGDGESRLSEAHDGAHFLEIDEVRVMDFNDTQMGLQMNEIVKVIENMVIEFQPNLVFTHSRHDLHQDHQAVYEATLRALRTTRATILSYESPSVTQDFTPNYFIDVCGYVDVKIEAIQSHWDQHRKPYMKPDLVRSKLSFRGNQAKIEYAEGYEIVRMVSAI